MFRFEKLDIYKEAKKLTNYLYKVTLRWPKTELYALADQIKRSSTSIVLNIAEGSSRGDNGFRHYLDISRESCYETVAIVDIAKENQFLDDKEFTIIYDKCEKLAMKISAFKKALEK
jgi:four helix bundle protein